VKGLELGFLSVGQYMDILKQIGIRIKEETVEPSGSAEVPEEDAEADDVDGDTAKAEAHLREQSKYGLTGGTWGCPECGYTLLNPLVSAELIICPKCGFEPNPEIKKKSYYDMLLGIIRRYKQDFPDEKLGEET
jgi:hypothetical protein